MLVSIIDVVLAVTAGPFIAILYKWKLHRRSENWYLFTTLLVVGLLWIKAASLNFLINDAAYLDSLIWSVPMSVGIVYVLGYPLWIRATSELTFIIVGRRSDQGGLIWVFRLSDRTSPIRPSWCSDANRESDQNDNNL